MIQLQDEKDRQATYLYGINEEMGASGPKPAVKVNNQCMMCSGSAAYIKKAFKMACIGYASSEVRYNDREWKRVDLMKRQADLVNGLETVPLLGLPKLDLLQREDRNVFAMAESPKPVSKISTVMNVVSNSERDGNEFQGS